MIVQSNLKPDFIKSFTAIQKEIHNVVKNSNNPFYKTKYADLSSVWDEIKDKAIKNGFCIQQTTYINESGENCLKVRLLHECGDFIDSDMKLLLAKNDMQAIGSAITYARRYLLMAMFGICPEDDDGNATTPETTTQPKTNKSTMNLRGKVMALYQSKRGKSKSEFNGWLGSEGFEDLEECSVAQLNKLIKELEK